MEILSGPWFIAIGSTLVIAVIQFIINSYVYKNKIKKDIKHANSEIITSIRPTFAENKKLDHKVIKAIIRAKAKKYNINESDLFNFGEIFDVIIDEIMSISYLLINERTTLANKVEKQRPEEDKPAEVEKGWFLSAKKFLRYVNLINILSFVAIIIIGISLYILLYLETLSTTTTADLTNYLLSLAIIFLISILITSFLQSNMRIDKKDKKKGEGKNEPKN